MRQRFVVLLCCVAVLAPACGTPGRRPGNPPGDVTPLPNAMATVDAGVVTGLRVLGDGGDDPQRQVHTAYPEIPGAAPLTAELRSQVSARVSEFTGEQPSASAASDSPARPELNVSWTLVGASPAAVGVRLETYEFAGANGASAWRTTWFDPRGRTVHPAHALVENRLDLLARLRERLRGDARVDLDRLAPDHTDALLRSIGFTGAGDLVVEFDEYALASGADGRIAVVFSASDSAALLSTFGRVAKDAAMKPRDPAIAPSPSAAPSPTLPAPSPPPAVLDCARAACVALTFDDGPGAPTGRLLDILRARGVKATFFLIGQNAAAMPGLARRTAAEGHEVANHSWSHRNLTQLSAAQVGADMTRTNDAIARASGVRPTLMRPPYGAVNPTAAGAVGMPIILWSVDTRDWADRNPAVVRQRAGAVTGGGIILMHDIHATTVDAVPGIVDALRGRGYTFVTVSQLFGGRTLLPGQRYLSR